jgi:hypothetical protein
MEVLHEPCREHDTTGTRSHAWTEADASVAPLDVRVRCPCLVDTPCGSRVGGLSGLYRNRCPMGRAMGVPVVWLGRLLQRFAAASRRSSLSRDRPSGSRTPWCRPELRMVLRPPAGLLRTTCQMLLSRIRGRDDGQRAGFAHPIDLPVHRHRTDRLRACGRRAPCSHGNCLRFEVNAGEAGASARSALPG